MAQFMRLTQKYRLERPAMFELTRRCLMALAEKKVVVVGAGMAGLAAACEASLKPTCA